MSNADDNNSDATNYDLVRRIREARRAFQYALTYDVDARARMFTPAYLLETLRKHIDESTTGTPRERCGRLFVLTVVLYASLDWQFAGQNVDVELDVRAERVRQHYRYGGPQIDDRLSPNDWKTRMRHQIIRLEQQLAVEELYITRLVKLAAITQAALEAASRQLS